MLMKDYTIIFGQITKSKLGEKGRLHPLLAEEGRALIVDKKQRYVFGG